MSLQISKDVYTREDLDRNLAKIESSASIHYAEKEELADDDVINHMPYNSGIFFEKIVGDQEFFKKSIGNDIEFSKKVFG